MDVIWKQRNKTNDYDMQYLFDDDSLRSQQVVTTALWYVRETKRSIGYRYISINLTHNTRDSTQITVTQ